MEATITSLTYRRDSLSVMGQKQDLFSISSLVLGLVTLKASLLLKYLIFFSMPSVLIT